MKERERAMAKEVAEELLRALKAKDYEHVAYLMNRILEWSGSNEVARASEFI